MGLVVPAPALAAVEGCRAGCREVGRSAEGAAQGLWGAAGRSGRRARGKREVRPGRQPFLRQVLVNRREVS